MNDKDLTSEYSIPTYENVTDDKLSFISLYFFVLIYFVVLTFGSEISDDTKNTDKKIDSLYSQSGEKEGVVDESEDQLAIFFSKKLQKYLPMEIFHKDDFDKQIIYTAKIAWTSIFANNSKKSSNEFSNILLSLKKLDDVFIGVKPEIFFKISIGDQSKDIVLSANIIDKIQEFLSHKVFHISIDKSHDESFSGLEISVKITKF